MLQSFDRRYVINLPDRTDRRNEFETQLRDVGASAVFFPAYRFDSAAPFHRTGSRGNYMSQLAVLKLSKGCRNVLIMEDDLNFAQDFNRRLAIALEKLPNDWGIFYCASNSESRSGSAQEVSLVSPNEEFIGSHFYAVNGWAIEALVRSLEGFLLRERDHPDGGPMPIDGALNVFRRKNPNINAYHAIPNLGYQRSSRSDCSENKWFDKNAFTGPLVAIYRGIKNMSRS